MRHYCSAKTLLSKHWQKLYCTQLSRSSEQGCKTLPESMGQHADLSSMELWCCYETLSNSWPKMEKKIWSRMLKLTKNPANFEVQHQISFPANRLTGTINVRLQNGCVFLALRFPILPFMAPLSHGLLKIYFGLIICCQKRASWPLPISDTRMRARQLLPHQKSRCCSRKTEPKQKVLKISVNWVSFMR